MRNDALKQLGTSIKYSNHKTFARQRKLKLLPSATDKTGKQCKHYSDYTHTQTTLNLKTDEKILYAVRDIMLGVVAGRADEAKMHKPSQDNTCGSRIKENGRLRESNFRLAAMNLTSYRYKG